MNRITYVELAGEKYPLIFSIGAAKKIIEKYGDLEKIDEALEFNTSDPQTLDMLGDVMAILMQQGCAYKNKFEKDLPPEPGVHIEDGEYIPLTHEEIDVCMGLNNEEMIIPIFEAINKSMKTELDTDSKNDETPKGE